MPTPATSDAEILDASGQPIGNDTAIAIANVQQTDEFKQGNAFE